MVDLIKDWFVRRFSHPQVFILLLLVVLGLVLILTLGDILAPLIAAVVIAYLLEGVVGRLERLGLPRLLVVSAVFSIFLTSLIILIFGVVPLLAKQVSQLVQQLPAYITTFKNTLQDLPERYPELLSQGQIASLLDAIGDQLAGMGQALVTQTLSSISGVITLLIFLVLLPILVFFLMKDKSQLVEWFQQFLPKERGLAISVWREVDIQLGNYIRGKTLEILIVGSVTFIILRVFEVQYAALLATLVGLSVLVPYIGAAVVTLPIAIVAFYQFGWTAQFAWVMAAYGIIQVLDGNALVPLLFSEVVNLHPVAIIGAVLLFGGLWGFWGVFFAIPLATLCSAILRAIRVPPAEKNKEESVSPRESTQREEASAA